MKLLSLLFCYPCLISIPLHHASAQEHRKNKGPVTREMKAYLQQGKACLTILVGAPTFQDNVVLGGAATCSKGFVTCFVKVPLACLGSLGATVQPTAWGTLRKQFKKPLELRMGRGRVVRGDPEKFRGSVLPGTERRKRGSILNGGTAEP